MIGVLRLLPVSPHAFIFWGHFLPAGVGLIYSSKQKTALLHCCIQVVHRGPSPLRGSDDATNKQERLRILHPWYDDWSRGMSSYYHLLCKEKLARNTPRWSPMFTTVASIAAAASFAS